MRPRDDDANERSDEAMDLRGTPGGSALREPRNGEGARRSSEAWSKRDADGGDRKNPTR